MRFYFYNSYQHSFVGYQLSEIQTGDCRLRCVPPGYPQNTVKSCLMNSGIKSILYRNYRSRADRKTPGDFVMCAKGISVKSALDGRKWYINFAVTAKEAERKQFVKLAHQFYFTHEAFLEELSCWFSPEPEEKLSYSLDEKRFERYLSAPFSITKENNTAESSGIKKAMDYLEHGIKSGEICILFPEADEGYFRKQNQIFRGMKIKYCGN